MSLIGGKLDLQQNSEGTFTAVRMPVVRDIPIEKVAAVISCLVAPDHILPGGVTFAVSAELNDPKKRRVYMSMQAFSKLKNTTSFDPTYWEEV
jgi:hypothetical protein